MKALKIPLFTIVVLSLILFVLPDLNSLNYLDLSHRVQNHLEGKYIDIDGKKVHFHDKGVGETVILFKAFYTI